MRRVIRSYACVYNVSICIHAECKKCSMPHMHRVFSFTGRPYARRLHTYTQSTSVFQISNLCLSLIPILFISTFSIRVYVCLLCAVSYACVCGWRDSTFRDASQETMKRVSLFMAIHPACRMQPQQQQQQLLEWINLSSERSKFSEIPSFSIRR